MADRVFYIGNKNWQPTRFLRCILVLVVFIGLSGCLQRSHRLLTKDTLVMPVDGGIYAVHTYSSKKNRWTLDAQATLHRDDAKRSYRVTVSKKNKKGKTTTEIYTARFHALPEVGLHLVELKNPKKATYYVFPARLNRTSITLLNGLNHVMDQSLRRAFGISQERKTSLLSFSTDRSALDLAIIKKSISMYRSYFKNPKLKFKRLTKN